MIFRVWVTMLSDYNYEKFVVELINNDCDVCALGDSLLEQDDDDVGCLFAAQITTDEYDDPMHLGNIIEDIAALLDMKVFSVIVVDEDGDAHWSASNIQRTPVNEKITGSPYRDNN